MEVSIAGADAPNSMFAHEHRGLGVVPEIPGDTGDLADNVPQHILVSIRLNQECQPRGGRDCVQKRVGGTTGPGTAQNARVGHVAKEFIADPPRQKPRRASFAPTLDQAPAAIVLGSALVSRVHQHVCVHHEQLSTLHGPVERVPVGDVHERAATVEGRERGQWFLLSTSPEEVSEGCFHEFGHGAARTRGLPFQPHHH